MAYWEKVAMRDVNSGRLIYPLSSASASTMGARSLSITTWLTPAKRTTSSDHEMRMKMRLPRQTYDE
jgi:hypothetical protein